MYCSSLADAPPSIFDSTFEGLERCVVLLYDKTCQLTEINEALGSISLNVGLEP